MDILNGGNKEMMLQLVADNKDVLEDVILELKMYRVLCSQYFRERCFNIKFIDKYNLHSLVVDIACIMQYIIDNEDELLLDKEGYDFGDYNTITLAIDASLELFNKAVCISKDVSFNREGNKIVVYKDEYIEDDFEYKPILYSNLVFNDDYTWTIKIKSKP